MKSVFISTFLTVLFWGSASTIFEDCAIARETAEGGQQKPADRLRPSDAAARFSKDKDGLSDLIRELQSSDESTDETEQLSNVTVPVAQEIWRLSDRQCMNILDKAGIQSHKPNFATPFVKTPMLLDGPVEGVTIESKWPEKNVRRVMDCRLIVALIQLARRAREADVIKIEYYSAWRPVTTLENCQKGLKGRRCRKVAERASKGQLPSQHSRATAIDIRWFTLADGTSVDVEADYEKHFHEPPCDDQPTTAAGQMLQRFVCALHQDRVFSVMLTPNADRDHYNHLHFDITPGAGWYILR